MKYRNLLQQKLTEYSPPRRIYDRLVGLEDGAGDYLQVSYD
jgi:hypothetical protein